MDYLLKSSFYSQTVITTLSITWATCLFSIVFRIDITIPRSNPSISVPI